MEGLIFRTPYSSGDSKSFTYWTLNTHFKIISDKEFARGDILEFVKKQGNIIYTKTITDQYKEILAEAPKYGCFVTLDPIDPASKYILKEHEGDILLKTEITDGLNKMGVIFIVVADGGKIRFGINDKEDIIVEKIPAE